MNEIIKAFIAEARLVPFVKIAGRFGRVSKNGKAEWVGPCPQCGGKDRYNVNWKKGAFFCRRCDARGTDAIALAAHELKKDVRNPFDFLEACSEVLGQPIPDGGAVETDEEREVRLKRIAHAEADAERRAQEREDEGERQRQKAIRKGRGIYFNAGDDNGVVAAYLKERIGFDVPEAVFENIRFDPAHSYWSDAHRDERGYATIVHQGPAQIAPFVSLDGEVVGCHETWIDMSAPPKFRVVLWTRSKDAAKAGVAQLPPKVEPPQDMIEAGHYERMASKKMQGSKLGALIPVLGDLSAARWVAAEGIESVLGFAALDGWREDTLYLATGAMDNLAGKADPESAFSHPTIKDQDARGRWRARRIPGPVPAANDNRALTLPDHVREFVIAVDGDSEPVWTASAIARAEARLAREGLTIVPCWPPEKMDWADVAKQVAEAMKEAA
jgi:hypothetical protein